jgi:hypothetical protein
MPTVLQFRRGTSTQNNAFTGSLGEISVDTTIDTLRVHDGSTAGGFELTSNTATQTLTNKTLTSPTLTSPTVNSGLTLNGNSTVAGNIVPSVDDTYALGSPSAAWSDVYVGPGSLFINGQKVLEDSSGTITVQADEDQSLTVKTTGTGVSTIQSAAGVALTSSGSADITFTTSSGQIVANGDIQMGTGATIVSADENPVIIGDDLQVNNSLSVRSANGAQFYDSDNSNYVALKSPSAVGSNLTFLLPGSDGTSGQFLTTNGSGTLSFATVNSYTDSDVESYLSGGTGVTFSSGEISIGQAVATNSNVTFNNLTLSGNLTVNGTTTTVDTTNTTIADNLIELNSGATSNANDAGILIERGSTGDNAIIAWDESADKFIVGTTTATNASTGNLTISTGTLVANVEGAVTGNASTATALATGRTIGLSGDVTATGVLFDGTGAITLSTTIAANSVALGTDTTGNYVATISAGTGISGSSSSEGGTPTIALSHLGLESLTDPNADRIFFWDDSEGAAKFLTVGSNLTLSGTTLSADTQAPVAGTAIDVSGTTVNLDLSELTTSTADGDGDFFIVVDAANAQKKLTKANINISGFNNDANYSTTTGTVTSVTGGNGLTGSVTTSGSLAVGAGTGIDVAADAISVDVSDFMTNGVNNRVLTATGTDAMNAEANMTFDGSTLAVTGAITATGDVTAFSTSDKNLKQNIVNIDNSLDKVFKLNGVYYNWTKEALEKNNNLVDKKEVGVIAQDVETVLPELVATREDGTKAVRYERMCALLIECVKDLKNQIDELKK